MGWQSTFTAPGLTHQLCVDFAGTSDICGVTVPVASGGTVSASVPLPTVGSSQPAILRLVVEDSSRRFELRQEIGIARPAEPSAADFGLNLAAFAPLDVGFVPTGAFLIQVGGARLSMTPEQELGGNDTGAGSQFMLRPAAVANRYRIAHRFYEKCLVQDAATPELARTGACSTAAIADLQLVSTDPANSAAPWRVQRGSHCLKAGGSGVVFDTCPATGAAATAFDVVFSRPGSTHPELTGITIAATAVSHGDAVSPDLSHVMGIGSDRVPDPQFLDLDANAPFAIRVATTRTGTGPICVHVAGRALCGELSAGQRGLLVPLTSQENALVVGVLDDMGNAHARAFDVKLALGGDPLQLNGQSFSTSSPPFLHRSDNSGQVVASWRSAYSAAGLSQELCLDLEGADNCSGSSSAGTPTLTARLDSPSDNRAYDANVLVRFSGDAGASQLELNVPVSFTVFGDLAGLAPLGDLVPSGENQFTFDGQVLVIDASGNVGTGAAGDSKLRFVATGTPGQFKVRDSVSGRCLDLGPGDVLTTSDCATSTLELEIIAGPPAELRVAGSAPAKCLGSELPPGGSVTFRALACGTAASSLGLTSTDPNAPAFRNILVQQKAPSGTFASVAVADGSSHELSVLDIRGIARPRAATDYLDLDASAPFVAEVKLDLENHTSPVTVCAKTSANEHCGRLEVGKLGVLLPIRQQEAESFILSVVDASGNSKRRALSLAVGTAGLELELNGSALGGEPVRVERPDVVAATWNSLAGAATGMQLCFGGDCALVPAGGAAAINLTYGAADGSQDVVVTFRMLDGAGSPALDIELPVRFFVRTLETPEALVAKAEQVLSLKNTILGYFATGEQSIRIGGQPMVVDAAGTIGIGSAANSRWRLIHAGKSGADDTFQLQDGLHQRCLSKDPTSGTLTLSPCSETPKLAFATPLSPLVFRVPDTGENLKRDGSSLKLDLGTDDAVFTMETSAQFLPSFGTASSGGVSVVNGVKHIVEISRLAGYGANPRTPVGYFDFDPNASFALAIDFGISSTPSPRAICLVTTSAPICAPAADGNKVLVPVTQGGTHTRELFIVGSAGNMRRFSVQMELAAETETLLANGAALSPTTRFEHPGTGLQLTWQNPTANQEFCVTQPGAAAVCSGVNAGSADVTVTTPFPASPVTGKHSAVVGFRFGPGPFEVLRQLEYFTHVPVSAAAIAATIGDYDPQLVTTAGYLPTGDNRVRLGSGFLVVRSDFTAGPGDEADSHLQFLPQGAGQYKIRDSLTQRCIGLAITGSLTAEDCDTGSPILVSMLMNAAGTGGKLKVGTTGDNCLFFATVGDCPAASEVVLTPATASSPSFGAGALTFAGSALPAGGLKVPLASVAGLGTERTPAGFVDLDPTADFAVPLNLSLTSPDNPTRLCFLRSGSTPACASYPVGSTGVLVPVSQPGVTSYQLAALDQAGNIRTTNFAMELTADTTALQFGGVAFDPANPVRLDRRTVSTIDLQWTTFDQVPGLNQELCMRLSGLGKVCQPGGTAQGSLLTATHNLTSLSTDGSQGGFATFKFVGPGGGTLELRRTLNFLTFTSSTPEELAAKAAAFSAADVTRFGGVAPSGVVAVTVSNPMVVNSSGEVFSGAAADSRFELLMTGASTFRLRETQSQRCLAGDSTVGTRVFARLTCGNSKAYVFSLAAFPKLKLDGTSSPELCVSDAGSNFALADCGVAADASITSQDGTPPSFASVSVQTGPPAGVALSLTSPTMVAVPQADLIGLGASAPADFVSLAGSVVGRPQVAMAVQATNIGAGDQICVRRGTQATCSSWDGSKLGVTVPVDELVQALDLLLLDSAGNAKPVRFHLGIASVAEPNPPVAFDVQGDFYIDFGSRRVVSGTTSVLETIDSSVQDANALFRLRNTAQLGGFANDGNSQLVHVATGRCVQWNGTLQPELQTCSGSATLFRVLDSGGLSSNHPSGTGQACLGLVGTGNLGGLTCGTAAAPDYKSKHDFSLSALLATSPTSASFQLLESDFVQSHTGHVDLVSGDAGSSDKVALQIDMGGGSASSIARICLVAADEPHCLDRDGLTAKVLVKLKRQFKQTLTLFALAADGQGVAKTLEFTQLRHAPFRPTRTALSSDVSRSGFLSIKHGGANFWVESTGDFVADGNAVALPRSSRMLKMVLDPNSSIGSASAATRLYRVVDVAGTSCLQFDGSSGYVFAGCATAGRFAHDQSGSGQLIDRSGGSDTFVRVSTSDELIQAATGHLWNIEPLSAAPSQVLTHQLPGTRKLVLSDGSDQGLSGDSFPGRPEMVEPGVSVAGFVDLDPTSTRKKVKLKVDLSGTTPIELCAQVSSNTDPTADATLLGFAEIEASCALVEPSSATVQLLVPVLTGPSTTTQVIQLSTRTFYHVHHTPPAFSLTTPAD